MYQLLTVTVILNAKGNNGLGTFARHSDSCLIAPAVVAATYESRREALKISRYYLTVSTAIVDANGIQ
jgi:hypothetical protein